MSALRLDVLRRDRAAIADAVRARVGAGAPYRAPGDRARVDGYLRELELGFHGWAHGAAVRLLGTVLGAAFAAPGEGLAALGRLDERLVIGGAVAAVRAAADADVVVYAPTRSSNLDPVTLAVALARLDLPPCVYPAGERLYRNPLVARLLKSQGALRVDRGRHAQRYLAVVAAYVAALAERGAALAVFPGVSRRRDGTVEQDLHVGLVAAAARVAAAGGRRVHVVPVTISQQIVLEAGHLVDHHLRRRGHQPVIGDDLFVLGRLIATARRLRHLDQRVVVRFGAPIPGDRRLAPAALAARLAAAYRADSVFLDTHVVGRALDDLRVADTDRAVPFGASASHAWPVATVVAAIEATGARLDAHPGDGARWAPGRPPEALLACALAAWGSAHPRPAASRHGDHIALDDPRLAWFYGNRTRHVGSPPPVG